MDEQELRDRVADLSVWRRGSERAPHKPLLLLWALGRCAAGRDRMASHSEIDEAVRPLLEEFGPPRKSDHTEYPFWYLRKAAVLVAYGYRCAVCGFDARLGNIPLAIEAAHIKWHQAGGPDRVTNGLGLCSLHHKLLDRGAFTLRAGGEVVVSDLVNGGEATEAALFRFHGKEVQLPRQARCHPEGRFFEWHRDEVFKG